jgi:protein gp37
VGENSNIAWCDHTFNPWEGCTAISPGCDNCYAETLNHRWGKDNWGKGRPRRVMSDANWQKPLKWDREALGTFGRPARVFCGSICDIMDDEAPAGQRDRLWELINKTPNLDWLLLTKRPHRYQRYLPPEFKHHNVIYGTTTENQEFYNVRYPILADVVIQRGGLHFVSYEPAIAPLSIYHPNKCVPDWIIFGGETGPHRRPCDVAWAERLLSECKEYGTRFFMKQMSAANPGAAAAAIPEHLRIQQFYPSKAEIQKGLEELEAAL